ncbi:cysteine desulfurase NifS [Caulobacter flavus]|uniref:Cysteine desulfurase n=1 Tax=Caulobacter flavus TaxID=1679497 RepID=A0A2N5CMZ2_9CAUL|nr:cysteine desulfurase family protein [Caulobacter flavus]AYV46563.1 cysteine desulfurase NifS [Caulobacter flavus]PLR07799.1 cysteine desulfurase NifS [Caulobacter flavus]
MAQADRDWSEHALSAELTLTETLGAEGGTTNAQINLDANANAAPTPIVIKAVVEALQRGANPSSAHAAGEIARAMLEKARDAVIALSEGVYPENVIFTSGCTEANNLVVASHARRGGVLITSAVEHPSLLRPAEALSNAGFEVRILPVDRDGLVDLETLAAWLNETTGPVTVSIQTANSETGVVQPIATIANLIARFEAVLFHSDAAQSFGKQLTLVGRGRGPDMVSISGHKLHAPMGVGALLVHEEETRLTPQLLGGEQEQGLRAGTQALPMIAGLAVACAERARSLAQDAQRMALLRDRLEAGVLAALPRAVVNGGRAPRLPNVTNLLFPGVDAMSIVANLDAEGVLASQGSACSSRRPEPSHVLRAMGLSENEAFSCVRFSVSPLNTETEIDTAITAIAKVYQRLEMCA